MINTLRQQASTYLHVLKKGKLPPSLGNQTLEWDDVKIAISWLRGRKKNFEDRSIIEEYHKLFASFIGAEFAYSFSGARIALTAAIKALNLKSGDEVIVPGYTCVVVVNSFVFEGIKPVFADIELDTYGLDVEDVEKKITPRTRAILLHHLYGLVSRDYEALLDIARSRKLFVIEDCAQSTGAEYKGKKVGTFGDVGIFSSEQSKVFNTFIGGVAVTNDESIAHRIKKFYDEVPFPDENMVRIYLKNIILNYFVYKHSLRWMYRDIAQAVFKRHFFPTVSQEEFNMQKPPLYEKKLPAPLAAIGINQLRKIDRFNELRRRNAKRWDAWCEENGYAKPLVLKDSKPVFLRYPVLVEEDKKFNHLWAFKTLNVIPGVWFVSQLHPVRDVNVKGCPKAEEAVRRCINFPTLWD